MVEWQAISATFAGLNVASTYVKGYLAEIKDDAVREKLAEILNTIVPLYAQVIALYESNLSLIQKADSLETKLREIEDWRNETKDYEPNEIRPGVIVYSKKAASQHPGPVLHLCANCLHVHRKQSIIQLKTEDSHGNQQFYCPNCEFQYVLLFPEHRKPPQQSPDEIAYR